jgi:hypothetical protein
MLIHVKISLEEWSASPNVAYTILFRWFNIYLGRHLVQMRNILHNILFMFVSMVILR